MVPAINPGETGDIRTHFVFLAEWHYQGATASTDPAAVAFGPKQWPLRQGLIRPAHVPNQPDLTNNDRKPVVYLPIRRRDGVDQIPSLTMFIALRPLLAGENLNVPDWVGTTVEVLLVNLSRVHDGKGDTVKLTGRLDSTLTCRIEISPDQIADWLKPQSALELIVNKNLLDFQFTMYGVRDADQQPVVGQSRNRLFLYCRKTAVFLPGLFASQLQMTTALGETVGYPDFWEDAPNTLDPEVGPTFNANQQRADVLECDDRGIPLLPCPKPTLLMLGGPFNAVGRLNKSVIDPFNSMHRARVGMLGEVPEDFRLYTLIIHPYDWRCDLTDAAAQLLNHLTELKTASTGLTAAPDTDDQVAIMGHSTGGVVIRRALAPVSPGDCSPELDAAVKNGTRLSADKLINQVFFLSVPFSGAPKAAAVLSTGLESPTGNRQIPFIIPESLVAVSLSMPIVYHLHTTADYPYRPSSGPSRPAPVALDIEADKRAFVADAIESGLMPAPWVVQSALAGGTAARAELAERAEAWHSLIAERHQRERGNTLGSALHISQVKPWFDAQVARRGLATQMKARKGPTGWSTYLAARAKAFHERSRAAMTDYWKSRSALFWGACQQSQTLRQINLTNIVAEYDSVQDFVAFRGTIATDDLQSPYLVTNQAPVGGSIYFERWETKGSKFIVNGWTLNWIGQLGAGDGTVPSDSQLAEHANVTSCYLTADDQEAPQHMNSTKSDHVWQRLVQSMHLGRIVPVNAQESAFNLAAPMSKTPPTPYPWIE